HLRAGLRFEIVQMHGGIPVFFRLAVGQPFAVARPTRLPVAQSTLTEVIVLIDALYLACLDVTDVKRHRLIDVGHLLAVGRPVDIVSETGTETGHLALLSSPRQIADGELILAGFIRPISYILAVGRPGRITLGNAG